MKHALTIVFVMMLSSRPSSVTAAPCPTDPPLPTTHFWLSPLSRDSPFAETPFINVQGESSLYIWGRPASQETITGLSLNLESAEFDAVEFAGVSMDNPALNVDQGKPAFRYEFTNQPEQNQKHRLLSIQGFTVIEQHNRGLGIGVSTKDIDPLYSSAQDAWRIAEVTFNVIRNGTEASLFLQIGTNGMIGINGSGRSTADFDVVFGGATDEPLCSLLEKGQSSILADATITNGHFETDAFELIDGTYWQGSGALLSMNIDGVSTYDRLGTVGAARLGGDLEIVVNELEYRDPTTPRGLDTFVLISALSGIKGVFEQVRYDNQVLNPDFLEADGISFRSHQGRGIFRNVTYSTTSMQMSNYHAIVGDADGNMQVQFADFLLLSSSFGLPGDWINGDFDHDGLVQFADFLLLASEFAPQTQTIPEPASRLVLLVCGGLQLVFFGRRRSRSHGRNASFSDQRAG